MSESGGGYDWLTLDDDEEVLWGGRPAPETMYGTYLVGVPLILLLGLGILIIVTAHLIRLNTIYVITSKAIYKKTGNYSRSVAEIEYEKVQNTAYSMGLVGRYFGYGDVEISTAGGSGVEMSLGGVSDPQAVQEQLTRRVQEVQGGHGDGTADADVLGEIADELRAIRSAVEADGDAGAPAGRDRFS